MANLAASAVTKNAIYYDGTNRRVKYVDATLVLTGQGGTSNKILASLFGMAKILRASPAVKSDDAAMYIAAPSYDGTFLLLNAVAADTAASAPGDVTATVHIVVVGIE